jgi:hypothetical protein
VGDAAWLRSAIGAADAATQALGVRENVTHRAHGTSDAFGTEGGRGPAVLRSALVQRKQGVISTPGGLEVKYLAIVSFVGPVDVDPRDEITLSDGVTGQLYVPTGGMTDPATGKPFLRTVYLRR